MLDMNPDAAAEAKRSSFIDSDSCLSVSPSPGVESEDKSFDFGSTSGNLNAALQTEKEFLNFMFSLPRAAKEEGLTEDDTHRSIEEIKIKVSPKPSAAAIISNASHVGLDHLDNLCKMMEQLKELRQQNCRLQHRVEYLEDLKSLQEMHRGMEDSLCGEKQPLMEGPLGNSSYSDLRLQEIQGSGLFSLDSEESMNIGSSTQADFLDVDDVGSHCELNRHSSEEDQPTPLIQDLHRAPALKHKKEHTSAWGKVKNIITYSKKDANRKRSLPLQQRMPKPPVQALSHSMSTTCAKYTGDAFPTSALSAVSDPEDYNLDEDLSEPSWDGDTDMEAGLWMKRRCPGGGAVGGAMKRKPHLTITVPSNEDLTTHKLSLPKISERPTSDATSSPKSLEPRTSPSLTPPSPRRPSNWWKVKQAFLTNYSQKTKSSTNGSPTSPLNKQGFKLSSSSSHDKLMVEDSDASQRLPPDIHRSEMADSSRKASGPSSQLGVQKNLVELQKTLTGEFSKKIHEWEKLKKFANTRQQHQGQLADDELPFEFRKKLQEWEKRKHRRQKEKNTVSFGTSSQHAIPPHADLKTRNYEENDLPPDFKKKFTEWQIRKALAGKGEQDVEEIQKKLGKDFNRKLAEWERMKVHSSFGVERGAPHRRSASRRPINARRAPPPVAARLTNLASSAAIGAGSRYEGKRSASKSKKTKEVPSHIAKPETSSKSRSKELQWLNKELTKIERHKQRLEREKEKFVEREARLEKMKHAMQDPVSEKKEICIKTSTGEFRFEGISQTFTKKLYEWEERRGIRPESSTFILLDPNYEAPADFKHSTPEPIKLIRSRSEWSLVEIAASGKASLAANHSASSLTDINRDQQTTFQEEQQRTSSEPILNNDSTPSDLEAKQADNELIENLRKSSLELIRQAVIESHLASMPNQTAASDDQPATPHKSTRSAWSVSCQDLTTNSQSSALLHRSDSTKSEEDYRSLIHENMALLGRLKEKEHVCRQLETQMGQIDNKMDNVADQHFKTMERLHRHVSHMRKSESFGRKSKGSLYVDQEAENEKTRLFIQQLKSRIVELESKGDKLMEEKEELEAALNVHKKQETIIAESLLLRIRELQDAGAEVNIQTVQCHGEHIDRVRDRHGSSSENPQDDDSKKERKKLGVRDTNERSASKRRSTKRSTSSRKRSKPKGVQKLHHLTSNLLFQAKQLEQALIYRHNLCDESSELTQKPVLLRQRSLRTESSSGVHGLEQKGARNRKMVERSSGRTWSSIEAIFEQGNSERWAQAMAAESQDLLHMNSELTRMAKELRNEMTNLWSVKESTSGSNSSISRTDILENMDDCNFLKLQQEKSLEEEERWLTQQAREVFQSIASLQDVAPKSSSEENIMHKVLPFCLVSSSEESLHGSQPAAVYRSGWQSADRRSYGTSYKEVSTSDEDNEDSGCRRVVKRRSRRNHSDIRTSTSDRAESGQRTVSPDHMDWDASLFGSSSTTFQDLVRADKQRNLGAYRKYSRIRGTSERSSTSYDEADVSATSSENGEDSEQHRTDCIVAKEGGLLSVKAESFRSNAPSTLRSVVLSSSFEYEGDLQKNSPGSASDGTAKQSEIRSTPANEAYPLPNGTETSSQLPISDSCSPVPRVYCAKEVVAESAAFETHVKHAEAAIRRQKGLRMRRLSDTQIHYDEGIPRTEIESGTGNEDLSPRQMNANTTSPVRRNQSENDIGSQTTHEENDSQSDGGDVFVATRRTLFSICDENHENHFRDKSHQNRLKKLKWDFENSQVLPLKAPICSVYETRLEKTLSKNDSEGRFSDDFDASCSQTPELPDSVAPPTSDQETECNQQDDDDLESPKANQSSVRDMVEMYNDRITRNQRLLINPFTMDEAFTTRNSESGARLPDDRMHVVSKSKSISTMVERPPVPHVLRCSSSSQVPHMGVGNLTRRKLGIAHGQNESSIQQERKAFVDDRIVSVCFGDEDSNELSGQYARATQIRKAKQEFLSRDFRKDEQSASCAEQTGEPSSSVFDDSLSYLDQSYDLTDNFSDDCLLDRSLSEQGSREAPPKPPRNVNCGLHPPLLKQESLRRRSEGSSPSASGTKNSYEHISMRSSAHGLSSATKSIPASREKKTSLGFLKFFKRNKPKEPQTIEKLCRQSLHVDIDPARVRPLSTSTCKAHNIVHLAESAPSSAEAHSSRTLPRESGLGVPVQNVHSCPSSPVTRPKSRTAQILERSKQLFKSKYSQS